MIFTSGAGSPDETGHMTTFEVTDSFYTYRYRYLAEFEGYLTTFVHVPYGRVTNQGSGAGLFWPNWSRSREIATAPEPAPDQALKMFKLIQLYK